ncbi:MAG: ROK family transcriptional regulator [Propionibacteriaceae bacterium]|nr:ROK family transcriptional regulator [Propionibacteriaceae bacterium]
MLTSLRENGPQSRTALAKATGLAPTSVSLLVDDLARRDLVMTDAVAATGARGRPRVGLRLNPAAARVLGIVAADDGLTWARADLAGAVLEEGRAAAWGQLPGLEAVAEAIAVVAAAECAAPAPAPLAAVAAAVARPVALDGTVIQVGPQGVESRPLEPTIRRRLAEGVAFGLHNDANVAARAEAGALWSRGLGLAGVAYLKADSGGIGGGVAFPHGVLTGAHGLIGEFGHLPVDPSGAPCPCGGRGCLAQHLSLAALEAAAGIPPAGGDADARVARLVALAGAGEPAAVAALDQAGRRLATAVSAIMACLDLSTFVLGGYLAPLGPWLLPGLRQALEARTSVTGSTPEYHLGGPAGRAALKGAVDMAVSAVLEDPTLVRAAG